MAEAIEQTEISTVQATAILMMIVMARIGERRMRDLMETMTQATEVPAEGIHFSS